MQKILKPIFLVLLSACGDGNFDFSQVDNSTTTVTNYEPNELPTPNKPDIDPSNPNGSGSNPTCASIRGLDGSGGFLWKPESDSNGNLVVLFPKEFTEKFQSVRVTDLAGVQELGKFSAFGNGNRQHWRFSKSGSEYTGQVIAESLGGECIFQVSNPSERQD